MAGRRSGAMSESALASTGFEHGPLQLLSGGGDGEGWEEALPWPTHQPLPWRPTAGGESSSNADDEQFSSGAATKRHLGVANGSSDRPFKF